MYVSPITAWELAVAARKPASKNPVHLNDTPQRWFQAAVSALEAKILPIDLDVAIESAAVTAATCHKDPGDCFLVATARVHGATLITRDGKLLAMAADGYVDVIEC